MIFEERRRSARNDEDQSLLENCAATPLSAEGPMISPRFLLILGVILMLLGILLPFLMIIRVLQSTFFLNFFSWGVSVAGLALGTIGFAMYSTRRGD